MNDKPSRPRVTFSVLPNDPYPEVGVCGVGSFRPAWLQRLASPKAYLLVYCILGVLQGAYFTYTVGIISTIEKRYAFDSRISGIILIADNISPIIISLVVGYYGGRTHRPRLIAFGMILVCISCLMSALPYFIFGPGLHMLKKPVVGQESISNGTRYDTCGSVQEHDCKSRHSNTALSAVVLFFIANFINGFGSNAFYTAGVSYLDDNVKKKDSPVYFSVSMAIRLLGPSLGFFMSSICLKYYEDPRMKPGLSLKDPRWVGAWWMGFIIIGVLLFVFTLPMFFFPKYMRKPSKEEDEEEEEAPKEKLPSIKDLPKTLWRLSKNKVYMFHTIGIIFHINGYMGYYLLMPRYMEAHFRKSASEASLISGTTGILTMLVGLLLGGMFVRKYKPRARFLTGYMVFTQIVSVLTIFIVMFLACPPANLDAPVVKGQASLLNQCNAQCNCNTRVFQPMCGADGKSLYFSPCHAGCMGTAFNESTNATTFTSCACTSQPDEPVDLSLGFCPFNCNMFVIFILVLCIAKFVSATGRVGSTIILLRCVNPEEKTLALGAIGCLICLFAFIPYPLIFGAIADSACLVWEESCGKRGNCWLYDVDKLRIAGHTACIMFVVAGTICDVFVWKYSGTITKLFDDVEVPTSKDQFGVPPCEINHLKRDDEEAEEDILFLQPRTVLQTGSVGNLRSIM